jgi:AcrR family transcriptional regulator
MPTKSSARQPVAESEPQSRSRILEAAFSAFREKGYAQTSTLEIATRAKVSKRELYALVGDKEKMLIACIAERAARIRVAANLPTPNDRDSLRQVLVAFGSELLRVVAEPDVVAVFRIAIAEAVNTPEIAASLHSVGQGASRSALRQLLTQARERGLVTGEPAEMSERFTSLLWAGLMIGLLLGVARAPDQAETKRRARGAADALLLLYP